MSIEINVPDVQFQVRAKNEGTKSYEWQVLTSSDIFLNKRVVVFALPGAFTPTCSSTHLPGYELHYDDIIKQDIDEVYCLSVNDSFVMNAWFADQVIEKVKALPDGNADFTRHLGMLVKKENLGFGPRSHRYSMVVDNGRIESIWVEDGKTDNYTADPFAVSDAKSMLEYLKEVLEPRREAIAAFKAQQEDQTEVSAES